MTLKSFIIEYLNKHHFVSVLDSDFHDAVSNEFPKLKRIGKTIGAQPVPAAMRALNELYKNDVVNKRIIGLKGEFWGFPKWVYGYDIRKD